MDKVVKSKVCLKYDSFLISSYIMNKSVEYIILKENKIIGTKKKFDKDYMDKKEENLKRKNAKCFREIMNDIYKIDLESFEEYQDLINDNEFLKIFDQPKFDDINNNLLQKDNEDEDDDEYYNKEKSDRFHQKLKTNIADNFEKSNEKEAKTKEFSPKKVSKIKVPSEKYNKIRKLKMVEDNKTTSTSKNKLTKSYLKIKMNEDIPIKINRSIKIEDNKKTILEKSNYNMDLSDINNNKIKLENKPKVLNKIHSNYKLIEPYKLSSNKKRTHNNNNNNIPIKRNSKKRELKKTDNNLFYFQTINVERDANTYRNNLGVPSINTIPIKREKYIIKKTEMKPNESQTITIKPYSRKVIPKAEKRANNNENSNEIRNINIRFKNIDLNMSNSLRNETEISKENKFNDFDCGNKNENKTNRLDNFNKTIEIKKKEKKGSNMVNSNNDLFNLNIVKKTKENDNFNYARKIKEIPLLNTNYKKLSMSVNKIKVNGVSNKHKLNKRLLLGVHKTPMKTNININNAIRRHIGVKRKNNDNASPDSKNSLNNSIDAKSKDNVICKISNNKQEQNKNKEYSCINLSKMEKLALNKSSNDNINISDKKLIDLKNNIVTDKSKKNENEKISSSNEEEGENDEDRNEIKISVNPTGDEVDQILDEIARNNDKYENIENIKRYKIFDTLDKGKNQSENNNPKIELIQINKKRSPTIVINNNINVNFDNKSIEVSRTLSKFKNFKIK